MFYTLTAGQRTPWIDFTGVSAFELQGINSGGSAATLYVANVGPTSETATAADEGPLESFVTTFFAKSLYAPMSRFGYLKNTGTGTLKVSVGQAIFDKSIGLLGEVGFSKGTSGRSNEMPS